MGFQLEVDMIRSAHELGMLTTPYVFDAEESTSMAENGADVVVAHMGLTTSGKIVSRVVVVWVASRACYLNQG